MKIIRTIAVELTGEERREFNRVRDILLNTVDSIMNNGINEDDDECKEFVDALDKAYSTLGKVLNYAKESYK